MKRSLITALALACALTGCGKVKTFSDKREDAQGRFDQHKARFKYALALEQFENGQIDLAKSSIRDTLNLDPEEPTYLLLMAKIQLEDGALAEAAETLRQITYQGAPVPEHYYLAGLLAERFGRTEEAMMHFEEARELQPLNRDYLMAYSETLVNLDRPDEAMGLLDDALDSFDGHWSLHALRGQILQLQDHPASAAEAFAQALVQNQDDIELSQSQAMALYDARRYAEAVAALRMICEDLGDKAPQHVRRALAFSSMAIGDFNTARTNLHAVTSAYEDDFVAWMMLARCELMLEHLHAAQRAADRAVRIAPERPGTQTLMGFVRFRQGQWLEARRALEAAIRVDPQDALAWCVLGRAVDMAGDATRAQACYSRARDIDPANELVRELLEEAGGATGHGQEEPDFPSDQ